jgi:GTP cyclohydrolase II
VGIISYNRKEGRALGEVVKYLVYNARPRAAGGDREEDYFERTRAVAGVEDLRFQMLATDPLTWLSVLHIDRWASMSNMKSEALAAAGITIGEHLVIPYAMVPLIARVEIGAKRAAGYFS